MEGAFNELDEWSVGAVTYRFCFTCGINGANLKSVFWYSLSIILVWLDLELISRSVEQIWNSDFLSPSVTLTVLMKM